MVEHMNVIDALSGQIKALLDLMQCAGKDIDIVSVNTAAEMCMTMMAEVDAECDKIWQEWKENRHD